MVEHDAWPALPYEEWAPTKKTLQMCTQMLGKARLALVPAQPQWLHSCLYLDAHGFTTGAMPFGSRVVTMGIDVFETSLWLRLSDGHSVTIPIGPNRTVAEVWADFCRALGSLGLEIDLWEKPQETADITPFSQNLHDNTIVPEHAQRFHRLLTSIDGVYEEFRSDFFGRSGVQFWWGAFDFAVLLFNGRHATPPDDRGYIMRYDLDAEHLNAGFWPGDDNTPAAGFYAYLVPRPDGCETAPIEPEHAGWVEAMQEWMMPYDAVRACDDPRAALLGFLRSAYGIALSHAGWNEAEHVYVKPEGKHHAQIRER